MGDSWVGERLVDDEYDEDEGVGEGVHSKDVTSFHCLFISHNDDGDSRSVRSFWEDVQHGILKLSMVQIVEVHLA